MTCVYCLYYDVLVTWRVRDCYCSVLISIHGDKSGIVTKNKKVNGNVSNHSTGEL